MSRLRPASSGTLLYTGSSARSGSPGKYICVTRRWIGALPMSEKWMCAGRHANGWFAVLVADESRGHEGAGHVEEPRRHFEQLLLRCTQVRAAVILPEVGRIDRIGAGHVVHRAISIRVRARRSLPARSSHPKRR